MADVRVAIDKLGRIVIPKRLRERLGLVPGSELEIAEQPNGFSLRITARQSSMVKIDGLWVHQGTAEPGARWDRVLEDLHGERTKGVSG